MAKDNKAAGEEVTEEKMQKLLQKAEISLVLDTYDDIFSDFDPRSFSERALSVDFLDETERASKDKKLGAIEMNFLIPANLREKGKEETIKTRLKSHFRKHLQMVEQERKGILTKGFVFVFFGVLFMIAATFVLYKFHNSTFSETFFVVLLEPAGWFLFWEGLDLLVFESKKLVPKMDFYKKMSKCSISFFTY